MLCVVNATKLIFSCSRFIHKVKPRNLLMDKPTAYFRLLNGSEQFQVTFLYKDETLNVEREFNFNRRLSEKVEDFLNRVKTNLEKVLLKKKKKNKEQSGNEASTFEVSAQIIKNNTPVSGSEICKDVLFSGCNTGLILKMNDIDFLISVNCPWVISVVLPTSMMVGFPVYPSKFEILFGNKTDSLFDWYKTKVSNQHQLLLKSCAWQKLGTGFTYIPTIEDLGCHLKLECTPSDGVSYGPAFLATSTNAVEAGPGFCPFENRHAFTNKRLKGNEFRILSYNILADVYAETDEALNSLFSYCPRYALTLDYRKQLFIKEIIGYNADVLCLQEVDEKVFNHYLDPTLSQLDYIGCYSQKGGTVREGVACFFLNERFELKDSHTVILGEEVQKNSCLSSIWECIKKKEALRLRVTDRHTALQVTVLKSKDQPNELLIIGNTHLYFHPDADHVRLLQAGIIIRYLTHFISVIASTNPDSHVSLMICGDFNSVPECGIYKLMTNKHVPQDSIDWKSNLNEAVEGLELHQPWNLASACGTPKYTNFTVGFADCLDYIFYQTDRLAVKQVIPMPSEEELRQHVAIPSVVFPSDHIALIADLCWIDND
ncbi:2',5'-phosphodiesterase 12 [Lycorma delicatula]|uniref:2',5'-phosphodiesterase 12 n=1 Tax=Lycorma delicatula TaxID=130591 RepID=UPI003F50FD62